MRHSQLRAFHHVALAGGFSRAAEAMNVTQPAVSDQVRRLEQAHDVLLFRRDGRQVVLTADGERLFALTRELFDVEDRIGALLTAARTSVRGELRLVVDAAHHISGQLADFRAAHPKVKVTLRTGNTSEVLARLRAYEADLGVVGTEAQDQDLDRIALSRSPIVCFAAREMAPDLGAEAPLAQIAKWPLVFREAGSMTRQVIEARAAQIGMRLTPRVVADGREAVRDLVAAGLGLGFVSLAELGDDPRFRAITIAEGGFQMTQTLICLGQRRDVPVIRAFLAVAQK